MNKTVLPGGYIPCLGLYDTQKAIGLIKQIFEVKLCAALHLKRVTAPLFVDPVSYTHLENDAPLRKEVCENMEFFGIKLDEEKNKQRGADIIDLSAEDSRVKILMVCTNEELMIARDTLALVNG